MPRAALPAKGRAQPCLAECQGDSIILVISNDSFTHMNPNTIRCAVDKRQQVMEAFGRESVAGTQCSPPGSTWAAQQGGRREWTDSLLPLRRRGCAKRDATPSWEVSRKSWQSAIHPPWTHHTPPSAGWVELQFGRFPDVSQALTMLASSPKLASLEVRLALARGLIVLLLLPSNW